MFVTGAGVAVFTAEKGATHTAGEAMIVGCGFERELGLAWAGYHSVISMGVFSMAERLGLGRFRVGVRFVQLSGVDSYLQRVLYRQVVSISLSI
jgi:hypothetical protein